MSKSFIPLSANIKLLYHESFDSFRIVKTFHQPFHYLFYREIIFSIETGKSKSSFALVSLLNEVYSCRVLFDNSISREKTRTNSIPLKLAREASSKFSFRLQLPRGAEATHYF